MSLRVLLADDSRHLLAALRDMLQAAGHQVVATAETGESALRAARELAPQVAVVDVDMPGGGPALVSGLVALRPGPRVMALTARDDAETVLHMLAAGAVGYVAKGVVDEDLEACVRRCAQGGLFVVGACSDQVRERLARLWTATR